MDARDGKVVIAAVGEDFKGQRTEVVLNLHEGARGEGVDDVARFLAVIALVENKDAVGRRQRGDFAGLEFLVVIFLVIFLFLSRFSFAFFLVVSVIFILILILILVVGYHQNVAAGHIKAVAQFGGLIGRHGVGVDRRGQVFEKFG